ncbi:MAG TPA: hypothetical protein VGH28_13960 [Polyangiaceae bacterium]
MLATYLMTSPHANMIGLYYLPLVTITHETGLSERTVRAALAVLASPEIDIAHYDADADLVWLPAMASYQIAPELKAGDKRRGGPIVAEASKVGAHRFTRAFWDRYGVAFGLGAYAYPTPEQGPSHAPSHAPPKGDEAQSGRAGEEQAQEQEQEQEQAQVSDAKPSGGSDVARRVFRYYAEQRAFHLGARSTVQVTDARLKLVRARLKEGFSEDDLLRAVDGLFATPWNMGENDRHTKYVDVEHVFREAKQVERHRATADERASNAAEARAAPPAGPLFGENDRPMTEADAKKLELALSPKTVAKIADPGADVRWTPKPKTGATP